MIDNPKSVKLVFENCDVLNVPFDYVEGLFITNITTSVNYSNTEWSKRTDHITNTDSLIIDLSKEFEISELVTYFGDNAYERILKYNDICWIEVVPYSEAEVVSVYNVKWPDNGDYPSENPNQNTYPNHHGDGLRIEIK